jgi:hypothetical protein
VRDGCLKKAPARLPIDAEHDDEAWVNRLAGDQIAEVARIFGDDDAVVNDTTGDNH